MGFTRKGADLKRIPLAAAPSVLDEAARRAGLWDEGGEKGVLITSPLLAAVLHASWNGPQTGSAPKGGAPKNTQGAPLLLAPEWIGPLPEGLGAASTDFEPAYRAAGEALGAYVAALRASGEDTATAGLIFAESPERPSRLLLAFVSGFAATSGEEPLVMRLPERSRTAPPSSGLSPEARVALEELLGADIRALLVAAGADNAPLLAAAARPGLCLGKAAAEAPPLPRFGGTAGKGLAFYIRADDAGIARALAELAAEARRGGTGGRFVAVPARLEAGPDAARHHVGGLTLDMLIRRAADNAKRK